MMIVPIREFKVERLVHVHVHWLLNLVTYQPRKTFKPENELKICIEQMFIWVIVFENTTQNYYTLIINFNTEFLKYRFHEGSLKIDFRFRYIFPQKAPS